jgi:hypothetical protein
MSQEKIFADGFSFKRNENAPDFVVGKLSMKVDEVIAFLKKHQQNGWVNIEIKYGRSGNAYCELNTFQPKQNGGAPNNSPQRKQGNIESNFTEDAINQLEEEIGDELPF